MKKFENKQVSILFPKYQTKEFSSSLSSLASLKEGWNDGKGIPNQECLQMAQHIVLRLKEDGIDEEPVLSASEEGYVDLTWDKKLYCTIECCSDGIICIITSVTGPLLLDVRTEEKNLVKEFGSACEAIGKILVP